MQQSEPMMFEAATRSEPQFSEPLWLSDNSLDLDALLPMQPVQPHPPPPATASCQPACDTSWHFQAAEAVSKPRRTVNRTKKAAANAAAATVRKPVKMSAHQANELEDMRQQIEQQLQELSIENRKLRLRDEVVMGLLNSLDDVAPTRCVPPQELSPAGPLSAEESASVATAFAAWDAGMQNLSAAVLELETAGLGDEEYEARAKELFEPSTSALFSLWPTDPRKISLMLAMNLARISKGIKVPLEQHWQSVVAAANLSREQVDRILTLRELYRSHTLQPAPPTFPSIDAQSIHPTSSPAAAAPSQVPPAPHEQIESPQAALYPGSSTLPAQRNNSTQSNNSRAQSGRQQHSSSSSYLNDLPVGSLQAAADTNTGQADRQPDSITSPLLSSDTYGQAGSLPVSSSENEDIADVIMKKLVVLDRMVMAVAQYVFVTVLRPSQALRVYIKSYPALSCPLELMEAAWRQHGS